MNAPVTNPIENVGQQEEYPSYTPTNIKFGSMGNNTLFKGDRDSRLKYDVEKRGPEVYKEFAFIWGIPVEKLRNRYEGFLRRPSNLPWKVEDDVLLVKIADENKRDWNLVRRYFPQRLNVELRNRFLFLQRYPPKLFLQKKAEAEAAGIQAPLPEPEKMVEEFAKVDVPVPKPHAHSRGSSLLPLNLNPDVSHMTLLSLLPIIDADTSLFS